MFGTNVACRYAAKEISKLQKDFYSKVSKTFLKKFSRHLYQSASTFIEGKFFFKVDMKTFRSNRYDWIMFIFGDLEQSTKYPWTQGKRY